MMVEFDLTGFPAFQWTPRKTFATAILSAKLAVSGLAVLAMASTSALASEEAFSGSGTQIANLQLLQKISIDREHAKLLPDGGAALVAEIETRARRGQALLRTVRADTAVAKNERATAEAFLNDKPSRSVHAARNAIHAGDRSLALQFILIRGLVGIRAYEEAADVAAYAITRATSDVEKSASWFFLGRALQERGRGAEALAAFRTGLNIRLDTSIDRRANQLESQLSIAVSDIKSDTKGATPGFCIDFTYQPQTARTLAAQDIRIEDYIAISPEPGDGLIKHIGKSICRDGLQYGQAYTVRVAPGIPAVNGTKTVEEFSRLVTIRDRKPSISFQSANYVLPKIGSTGLPLVTVNTDTVALELYRMPDEALSGQLANAYQVFKDLNGYSVDQLANNQGEKLWSGSVRIDSAKNERTVTAIPLDTLLPRIEPGIYALVGRDASQRARRWEDEATQWFIVSDLGITTYHGTDGLSVVVRSLSTALPQAGVKVALLARNNDVLAETVTDATGLARIDPGLLEGGGGRTPSAVAVADLRQSITDQQSGVTTPSDFAFLDMNKTPFDLSDRGVSGRPHPGPMDVFLYPDRGVYRPGETANITALLRDSKGAALEGVPLRFAITRPDGVKVSEPVVRDGGMGGRSFPITFTRGSKTGIWTVEARVEPDGEALATLQVQVEDIVPATIEVDASASVARIVPGETFVVTGKGDFLYGAPAANLRSKAELLVRPEPAPYAEFTAYRFGLEEEQVDPVRRDLGERVTDADGNVSFSVDVGALPDTPQPLSALVRLEILERGGRPVIETIKLPIETHPVAIGLRPQFGTPGSLAVRDGEAALFDVVALNPDGERLDVEELRWRLIEEERQYFWSRRGNRWDYDVVTTDVTRDSGTISASTSTSGASTVGGTQDWGYYRMEVFDPASGAATSVRYRVGWRRSSPGSATPDSLEISLSEPEQTVGQTVQAFIRAPFAGTAEILVANDRILDRTIVELPEAGAEVTIPVTDAFGVGAYIMATAYRPGDGRTHAPGRAVGVSYLKVDPAPKTLTVAFDAPQLIRPNQTLPVGLTIASAASQSTRMPVFVTLAAVDVGVLQLTDFETPDPTEYLLGKRALKLGMRDLYGRLIDGRVSRIGQVRSGGDDAAGAQRGAPDPNIEIVSLFSGPVEIDQDGHVDVPVAIPDFQGRLRLMAVAWNKIATGAGDAEIIVRDPLVTTLSMPRFLATGDRAELTLSLDPLDVPDGDYRVALDATGPVEITDAVRQITLTRGTIDTLAYQANATGVGTANLSLTISGPDGYTLARAFKIGTRAPRFPTLTRLLTEISPGGSFLIDDGLTTGFLPGSVDVTATLASQPPIDVARLVGELHRYPYGCLEQTASVAMPLLYLSDLTREWGLDSGPNGSGRDAGLRERVQDAVARILERQRFDGGFGLWSSDSPAEPWLSGYAVDFLQRARTQGYDVPDIALNRAYQYLQTLVRSGASAFSGVYPAIAYAHFVLARAGQSVTGADLGALRYFADEKGGDVGTIMGLSHLAGALALRGDVPRAERLFAEAIERSASAESAPRAYRDYGSVLRDIAAIIAIARETETMPRRTASLATELQRHYRDTLWTSTQEKVWLVLAANSLKGKDKLSITMNGEDRDSDSGPIHLVLSDQEISKGLRFTNTGDGAIWQSLDVIGVPSDPPHPDGLVEGFEISRSFLGPDYKPIDLTEVTQGDRITVLLEGSLVEGVRAQALLVDLLPAGFEIENNRLSSQGDDRESAWWKSMTKTDHVELRDDRFATAFDIGKWSGWRDGAEGGRSFKVAYVVRAVTPGTFSLPPAFIEDMYNPQIRGTSAEGQIIVRKAQ